MMRRRALPLLLAIGAAALTAGGPAIAHALRVQGVPVTIANTTMTVTPARDWNRLSPAPGAKAETWTLDGEALDDVTFFAGIEPGKPLLREASRSRKPLPKFARETLLVEVPELLEGTYRAAKGIAAFHVTGSAPDRFLGRDGIRFDFDYVDDDALPRRGEARAALVGGLLYMIVFAAPRMNYYDRVLGDYRALADSARLN